MCMCTGMCNYVYGRVLGAGAFQTQSWLSWFLLRSRAGGYGAGVHGRSRFSCSGCLWVTAVRRRGRPAKLARRVFCRPYAFCVLSLARPCHRRRQRRCSGRLVWCLPLTVPRRRHRHHPRHLPAQRGKIGIVVVSNSRFAAEPQRAVGPIDTCIWCRRHLSNIPEGKGESRRRFYGNDAIMCLE